CLKSRVELRNNSIRLSARWSVKLERFCKTKVFPVPSRNTNAPWQFVTGGSHLNWSSGKFPATLPASSTKCTTNDMAMLRRTASWKLSVLVCVQLELSKSYHRNGCGLGEGE